MKGTLYIQRDVKGRRIEKPEPLECEIDLGKDCTSIAGIGQKIVAKLVKSRVEFISANGLFISGLVEGHYRGTSTVTYQEWWFVPVIETQNQISLENKEERK